MHELSIANGIVEICAERAGDARVIRVRLEIGQLSAVMPDAVRFCFDVCARNTVVEGAALEIVETPGRALCRECDREVAIGATGWPLRLRQRKSARHRRRGTEDQGNGDRVMCTTCGCSDNEDVRYTMPGAHTHGPDGHTHSHDHAHPHPHDHDTRPRSWTPA